MRIKGYFSGLTLFKEKKNLQVKKMHTIIHMFLIL